jgi:hypothetical protein
MDGTSAAACAAATTRRGFGACAVENWSRMPLRGMHGACGAAVHLAREPPEGILKKGKKVACAVETWSRMPLRGMHGACGAAVHLARKRKKFCMRGRREG